MLRVDPGLGVKVGFKRTSNRSEVRRTQMRGFPVVGPLGRGALKGLMR